MDGEKIIRLELRGPVPNKKNLWRQRKGGGLFLDAEIKAQIDSLILQATMKWRRPPVEHPDIDVEFFVLDARSDRDNKLGCLLDVLQKANVLVNDNVKHFNGTVTMLPAVIGGQEGVIIDLRVQQGVLEIAKQEVV